MRCRVKFGGTVERAVESQQLPAAAAAAAAERRRLYDDGVRPVTVAASPQAALPPGPYDKLRTDVFAVRPVPGADDRRQRPQTQQQYNG